MAVAVEISLSEMTEFLTSQGFTVIPKLPRTNEVVFGKVVGSNLCLRVYTSIEGDSSRGVGEDAIRTVLVARVDGEVKIVGSDRRVHRVAGWRKNLQDRLDNWESQLGPCCPKCGSPTVRRLSKKGPFHGCVRYPDCRTVQPIMVPQRVKPTVQPVIKNSQSRVELDKNLATIMDSDE